MYNNLHLFMSRQNHTLVLHEAYEILQSLTKFEHKTSFVFIRLFFLSLMFIEIDSLLISDLNWWVLPELSTSVLSNPILPKVSVYDFTTLLHSHDWPLGLLFPFFFFSVLFFFLVVLRPLHVRQPLQCYILSLKERQKKEGDIRKKFLKDVMA